MSELDIVHAAGEGLQWQWQSEEETVPLPVQGVSSSSPPLPLVNHNEVVGNRDLFIQSLNQFHSAVGTKYLVPTIGGKELDLHRLYAEVTARGGLSKVIKDRKWKEIIGIFNFPPTTTSASFSLRKYYVSLLKAYEQVYFFQAQGQVAANNGSSYPGSDELQSEAKRQKMKSFDTPVVEVDPTSSVDQPVTGVIDGKFEHGYFVTVKMGADILRGVLYHMPSGGSGAQHADVSYFQSSNTFDAATSGINVRSKKKKECIRRRDPDHPKPNRSGYNFFFAEQHARLKALHPDKDREISKMIGELWNKLGEEERVVYQDFGLRDKERYKREMQEYNERLKGQSQITEASNQTVGEIWNSGDHKPECHSPVGADKKGCDSKMAFITIQSGTTNINITSEQKSSNLENDCKKPYLEQGACG
ncbi:hypothetical protein KI387_005826, partial [Taxus chinensis]